MKKGLYEILQEVDKTRGEAAKIKALQANSSSSLKAVLGAAYDPNIIWDLPETDPPYKPMPKENDQQGRLYSEIKRFYIFFKGQTALKPVKREQLFIELLESVDPDDAKLLCSIKNKTLPFKTVNLDLVKKAFPNLAKDW